MTKCFLHIISLCGLFLSLVTEKSSGQNNHTFTTGKQALIIAHGGGQGLNPSNTMLAFDKTATIGTDVFEMDVLLTKDSILVLHHNETIDSKTTGTGYVKDFTLEELRRFNYGYNFKDSLGNRPYRNAYVPITPLEEVLIKYGTQYPMCIELKNKDKIWGKLAAEELYRLLCKYKMENKVIVACFDDATLRYFSRISEKKISISTSKKATKKFVLLHKLGLLHHYNPQASILQIPVESAGTRLDTQDLIHAAHKKNMKVHYWTINDTAEMKRLIKLGADGIITDRPDLMKRILDEMQEEKKKTAPYWNQQTCLIPWRYPIVNDFSKIKYEDLNADGKPDVIHTFVYDTIPAIWIDDDGDMKSSDFEGDTDNDCLLIDLNKDGIFAGAEDLSIDWIDTDKDGIADMQFVILNGKADVRYQADYKSDYICVIDTEKDDIKSFIDWNKLSPQCWEKNGHSNFFQDYHGNSLLLKMHASSFRVSDLRYNCENPFAFYDCDNDNLTEINVRLMDIPYIRPRPEEKKNILFEETDNQYDIVPSKKITWAAISWDVDNDNGQGNELDLDMTLYFGGNGFDYSDQVHPFKNQRLAEADRYFHDPRWRELSELVYPDEKASYDMIFTRGKWEHCWMVFDEDDDCNRWERVELYYPYDLFKVGAYKGGLDSHKQSDASGDRGEFDQDNSGKGKLYISPIDGKIHLYGAEWGAWRIDQNATYFQGYGGLYDPQHVEKRLHTDPQSYATIKYTDTDYNGFFDQVEYDLDGNTVFEEKISLKTWGIDDRAPLYDPASMKYKDIRKLFDKAAEESWERAQNAIKAAGNYGLNTSWYAFWKQPHTLFEKYNYGFWLHFYLYNDLKSWGKLNRDENYLQTLDKEYYSGKLIIPQRKK